MPATSPTPADLLAPDVAAVLGGFTFPHLSAELLPSFRVDMPGTEPPAGVEVVELVVPGGAEPDLRARVHRPVAPAEAPRPCVLSIHGGGYVLGSCTMDDAVLAEWAAELGVVGVAVEYRLAPETPWPGPLEDCYRALRWVHDRAGELGVDRARLGVRGSSAGGGLAASLALLASQRGEVPLAFQLLDSPMLDDRQVTATSQLDGLPIWSRESNRFGWESYLGARYGTDDVPSTAAPARATDEELAALPPAFVSVGAVDGFLDEDVQYALRLLRAGVPTELHVYPGACHGYQLAADSEVARQSRRDMREWVARQLAGGPAAAA